MRASILPLCILLHAACTGVGDPHPRLEFLTVGDQFDRGSAGDVEVPVMLRNTGDTSWWLGRCTDRLSLSVERWDGGAWVDDVPSTCQNTEPHDPPFELRPGETRNGVYTVTSGGHLRFRLNVALDGRPYYDNGEGISNAFDVR